MDLLQYKSGDFIIFRSVQIKIGTTDVANIFIAIGLNDAILDAIGRCQVKTGGRPVEF